jgi:16S rRNA (cytosine967-C5)-methyltransferase
LNADMTVRALAFVILGRVLLSGDHASQLLSQEAVRCGFKGRDRAFLWEITLGVLRWLGRLDWILSSHIKGYRRLPLEVKNVLRLSAYQLVFMDRVPPYSAVDEGVKLAKRWCAPKYHGLVNAVLRKVAGGPYPGVTSQGSSLETLSVTYAHPLWIVEGWRARMGVLELLQLARAHNTPAPFSLWVNTHVVDVSFLRKELKAAGVESKPHPFMKDTIIILTPVDITQLPQFHEGLIQPQDPASSLVVEILAPKHGEIVLDACAAPGIKTIQVAWAMGNRGKVVAWEIHPKRFDELRETCTRAGVKGVECHLGDVKRGAKEMGMLFDRVLLDAPCSDLGTIRRHPELKWRRWEEDIAGFAKKQRDLLVSLVPYLRTGGILVYSVCSPEPEEGEALIKVLLREYPYLGLVDFKDRLPEALHPFYHKQGFLTLYPHYANTDGFFIAKLKRGA